MSETSKERSTASQTNLISICPVVIIPLNGFVVLFVVFKSFWKFYHNYEGLQRETRKSARSELGKFGTATESTTTS